MLPDLNQMVIFAAVLDTGSFTAAAKALGIPKSTVSKRVAELEDRLGTRLLNRTTRRVKPTAAGAAYYAQCRKIVGDAQAADRIAAEGSGALRGLVRVTAPRLLEAIVEPVMTRFLAENVHVSLDLLITNRRVDLVEEGVDLAIRPGVLPDSSMIARRLGDVAHCVSAAPDYLARHPPVTKPLDLREHDCISFSSKGGQRTWTFERDGEKIAVPVRGRYSVSSAALVRRAAVAGLGVASVPEFIVADDLLAGRLVRILPGWSLGRGAVQLVYPGGRHASPSVRALIDRLVSAFADDPPWSRRAHV
ncbi:LysR family transcriptional regulator [Pendulispora albinea]|uniref:LysR family transcriptional regulator n=1 Tax=Pendulispora albinea TaxID=2741071 RepID=A0ABZ2M6T2_9BACT